MTTSTKEMTSKEIRIGLLGFGTVGSGVFQILEKNKQLILERTGVTFVVQKICVRDLKKNRSVVAPQELFTTNASEIISDPKIDMVVELMGGLAPAGELILEAIKNGKHVVTANKALLSKRGAELFRVAREKDISIGFEASVAGGIPIIKAIREGFVGNRIQEIYGIINGTANFILTEMSERGADFQEVLKQAQEAGYAEQDPTFDIKGIDAAQKLSLLISLCYGVEPPQVGSLSDAVDAKSVFVEGIDHITALDISFAKKMGYVIKLLAISKDNDGAIQARVHATMIPEYHPLADVNGVFNAIFLKGDAIGEAMFMGRGAGMMPTASAVVSDLAMIASGVSLPQPEMHAAKVQSMEDLTTQYYLRFLAVDKPGVLSQIARHLGDHEISIASVYQPERDAGSRVSIVIMTHEAKEKNIQQSISEIDRLDAVLDKTVLIRVENFDAK